ncbi:WecB/TagA/CpsF family glycosyltransferase [uncultured Roseibium sp.]|uniref:WecB/TagA/CpsF family glycosyltransferase n=1 Tax=uncultured Roseibium sp. TaxID=1936171 RepID=UPI002634C8C7|nr:WecB/TagA/CpsF family glycosyltransferase [uncultured Roseibium sp.]
MNKVDLNLPIRAGTTVIGPLSILRMKSEEAVQLVRTSVQLRYPLEIAICNAHTTLTAIDDPAFAKTLQQMTLLNDGIGIDLASRFLNGKDFPDNLNGTDLIPDILANVGIPLRIFLLGATEHRVKLASEHIEATYPLHEVVGYRNGYFDMDQSAAICDEINRTRPDLLLVGMGNPRQEDFIVQNRPELDATVAIGVGALFDFMSGSVIRAPKAVQAVGLEWLFRLLQEPRRLFHRYVVGIPRFFAALVKLKRAGRDA